MKAFTNFLRSPLKKTTIGVEGHPRANGCGPLARTTRDDREGAVSMLGAPTSSSASPPFRNTGPGTPWTRERYVARFWSRVEKTETCWLWTGAKSTGYGVLGRHRSRGNIRAHRLAWELLRGPIPEGFEVDHLCRVAACVNPDHLEPVTPYENKRRVNGDKTSCKHGHPFTKENTHVEPATGWRSCRTCGRLRARAKRLAARGAR